MEMPPQPASPGLGPLPPGRTGHACAQCRHRKQKCGGLTHSIKCRPCTNRRVKCSFQDEVMDLRENPYLRMRAPTSDLAGAEETCVNEFAASSNSIALIPSLSGRGREDRPVSRSGLVDGESTLTNTELLRHLQSLTEKVADLDRRLGFAQSEDDPTTIRNSNNQNERNDSDHNSNISINSSSRTHNAFPLSAQPIPPRQPEQHYPSPPLITSPGAIMTEGPLKTLNSFQTNNPVESEVHDPISQKLLTQGEAYVIFKLFFTHGHPNAPFLDVDLDSDTDRVRTSSTLLFLAILSVGARFWGASSKSSLWLHPRYSELVRLLDAEMMRVTLRPRQEDHQLETVQALMLCAHWMPLDISADRKQHQSRFSEAGAWHCLGLAIRWATSLALDRNCHFNFLQPNAVEATRMDVRRFRTMLYLTESDHYLALSARRPSHLNPELLSGAVAGFLRSRFVQPTDMRLASLFQVAYSAHFTNCRPTTIESVEAFDRDVQIVERQFLSEQGSHLTDSMSQHFPFTSLRWYRLSYTCTFLDNIEQHQRQGKALMWAIEWASQILVHLSVPPSCETIDAFMTPSQLEPDSGVVSLMSFAIDHYYVVISYASFFLVNSWLRNFIDLNLRSNMQQTDVSLGQERSSSLLYRLVDLAARTLEASSPPDGHLARRYVPLLRGMADLILVDNTQTQEPSVDSSTLAADINMLEHSQNTMGEDLWEMWQQAGLEPINWQMTDLGP